MRIQPSAHRRFMAHWIESTEEGALNASVAFRARPGGKSRPRARPSHGSRMNLLSRQSRPTDRVRSPEIICRSALWIIEHAEVEKLMPQSAGSGAHTENLDQLSLELQ